MTTMASQLISNSILDKERKHAEIRDKKRYMICLPIATKRGRFIGRGTLLGCVCIARVDLGAEGLVKPKEP